MIEEADYTVRVTLTVHVPRIGDQRSAISWELELVNEDLWRTLEAEGFTIEADAVPDESRCRT